jgi:hypothetical protein
MTLEEIEKEKLDRTLKALEDFNRQITLRKTSSVPDLKKKK